MHVHLRKVAFDVAQQLFVPLELVVGMQAPLHQNLIAAEIDGLLNLLEKHLAIERVAFGMPRFAIEAQKSQTAVQTLV